jgi:hypothetical protein
MSIADVAIRYVLTREGWFEDRFLPKTQRDDSTGCLLWTGSKNAGGYGAWMIKLPGKVNDVPVAAHRMAFAFEYGYGALPRHGSGGPRVVAHTCGNRLCVEPGHLTVASLRAVQLMKKV